MLLDKIAIVFLIKFAISSYSENNIYTARHHNIFTQNNFANQNQYHLDAGIGLRNAKYHWHRRGNKIVVPFVIDSRSGYSQIQIEKIYAAMRHISERTCINFKWRTDEGDYLNIYSGRWCTSYVGRKGGRQMISLERSSSCANQIGAIIHELVHSLGFVHMQSHANRDKYITVLSENIINSEKYQFEKISSGEASNYGTPYDYFSIMHYGMFAFSQNGRPTIMTKNRLFNKAIGQINKLSVGDVARIRNMYKCECIEVGRKNC